MLSTSPRPLHSSTQHPETKGEAARCSPLSGPARGRSALPRGSPAWPQGLVGVGAPRRPDRGRGEPDTAGPTGSILRAVLPGSRRLVAISLGSALRRRSRAARGARPASHGVRGPGRRQRPLGHAGPQLLSPSVTTFFREMALREAACLVPPRVASFLTAFREEPFLPLWPLGLPQGLFTLQALCKHYVLALREPQPLTTPWGPPCGALARTISPGRRTEAVFPSARRWCPRREGTFTRLLRLPVTERK